MASFGAVLGPSGAQKGREELKSLWTDPLRAGLEAAGAELGENGSKNWDFGVEKWSLRPDLVDGCSRSGDRVVRLVMKNTRFECLASPTNPLRGPQPRMASSGWPLRSLATDPLRGSQPRMAKRIVIHQSPPNVPNQEWTCKWMFFLTGSRFFILPQDTRFDTVASRLPLPRSGRGRRRVSCQRGLSG